MSSGDTNFDSMQNPENDRQIGQYVLEEKLGQGGMAEVWKARNRVLGTHAAIKFLAPGLAGHPEIEQRFLSEGKRQAALRHPNIVSAFDFLYLDSRSYLIMEYIDGESLDDRLFKLQSPMPLPEALSITRDVLGALSYAHAHDVIHRDVKPSNILLENGGRALVMDFGIALTTGEQRLTRVGMAVGTPHYMSPEQIVGARNIDRRADIYAFGCVLYQMLTQRVPFDIAEGEGDTAYLIKNMHLRHAPLSVRQFNSAIPTHIDQAILRCLQKKPADRFDSCEELLEAITRMPQRATVMEMPAGFAANPNLGQDAPRFEPMAGAAVRPNPLTPRPPALPQEGWMNAPPPVPANATSANMAPAMDEPQPGRSPIWIGVGVIAAVLLAAGAFLAHKNQHTDIATTPAVSAESSVSNDAAAPPLNTQPKPDPAVPMKTHAAARDASTGSPGQNLTPTVQQNPHSEVVPPVITRPPSQPPPVSPATPGHELSGHWQGAFKNLEGRQNTKIALDLSEGNADLLTGNLTFSLPSGGTGSCPVTGLYNPQRLFMVLDVGHCKGDTPHHLVNKFGFSGVNPTDGKLMGIDQVHNGLLDLEKQN